MKTSKPDEGAVAAANKMKHTTFRLTEAEHKQFKRLLGIEGDKAQDVLRAAVMEYIRDKEHILDTPLRKRPDKKHAKVEIEKPNF